MKKNKNILSDLYFLGPKSEQRKFLHEIIELINNDYIFWRRNLYPKDPPTIPHQHLTSECAREYNDILMQNLIQLLGELKSDVPFFSPRYIAHMTSEVALPALIGNYAGLLYHSNNVTIESSPVTLKYELEVGAQFADLFDFHPKNSFGHITSGGTIANLESVFYNKACRFIPASIALMFLSKKLKWPSFLPLDIWSLLNISIEEIPALLDKIDIHGKKLEINLLNELNNFTPSFLGECTFWNDIKHPSLIAPTTSHYSWSKAAHIFGIGKNNILEVKINKQMSMDINCLNETLEFCLNSKTPIIQLVIVLGTTEFGTFDPLDEIILLLKKWRKKGLYVPIHLDAAYGGYFNTIFKNNTSEIKNDHPLARLSKIFKATRYAATATIDPHKLGFTPYGAGIFITNHQFTKEFVAEKADYCLSDIKENSDTPMALGKYIIEGSKSGAMATSVYFTNKIIPLNYSGYGHHLENLIYITSNFYKTFKKNIRNDKSFSELFELNNIYQPESNILCFYLRPKNTFKASEINEFNLKLINIFFPGPNDKIQDFTYFVSKTKLKINKLTNEACVEIFENKIEFDADGIYLLRLVFLNKWINTLNEFGISYQDDFINMIKKSAFKIYNMG
jgi:glutamate/tyrosine decarboxylase-like PLP-dependent enzyme